MDYGTGHEAAFGLFLLCLCLIRFFDSSPSEERSIVLIVFYRYLRLCWRLQDVYRLEPAGSHGVWGLDDYSFLGYIFGSAQLRGKFCVRLEKRRFNRDAGEGQKEIPVSAILRTPLSPTNLYFVSISRIHEFKRGPFHEHSSQLYAIATGVPNWVKVHSGLFKMYEVSSVIIRRQRSLTLFTRLKFLVNELSCSISLSEDFLNGSPSGINIQWYLLDLPRPLISLPGPVHPGHRRRVGSYGLMFLLPRPWERNPSELVCSHRQTRQFRFRLRLSSIQIDLDEICFTSFMLNVSSSRHESSVALDPQRNDPLMSRCLNEHSISLVCSDIEIFNIDVCCLSMTTTQQRSAGLAEFRKISSASQHRRVAFVDSPLFLERPPSHRGQSISHPHRRPQPLVVVIQKSDLFESSQYS